ncbi:uncharacterized protein LOC141785488 [Halichoeres trimaculatus]|uniref:uncharacterized protein LOC141785488 n=1 Tax=Halichoeres trimaculatus TaxID=147232 RepID=UPI003D9EF5B3
MGARWWSCMLGLLCIPVEITISTTTVSQAPSVISLKRINSSAEITCSTSVPGAKGFSLHRYFKGNKQIVYLNLIKGEVTKSTIVTEFTNRIRVVPAPPSSRGQRFTLQLSLLGLDDTDVYFCSWSYLPKYPAKPQDQSGNGTIIIIRESGASETQCKSNVLDLIFIILSVAAFFVILLFCIGALIVRCNRFSGEFRPAGEEVRSRPSRPQHPSPQHAEHCPYLMTSGNPLYHRGLMQS